MSYLRALYRCPAAAEDDAVAALWGAGTLGVEVGAEDGAGRVRLSAWFAAGARPPDRDALPAGVEPLGEEAVADADWLAAYRERARPLPLGRGFLADPREPGAALPEELAGGAGGDLGPGGPGGAAGGRRRLRLPARGAFGTGSHESTRLAVELLEDTGAEGLAVLDVGTGTGVLAFAALHLGARSVVAFDVDPAAVVHARQNAALNGFALGGGRSEAGSQGGRPAGRLLLFAGHTAALAGLPAPDPGGNAGGSAGRRRAGFDLALVNVLPERILPELAEVAARLAPGGRLIFSGLLAAQRDEVAEQVGRHGLAVDRERRDGEWLALRLVRRPAGERR